MEHYVGIHVSLELSSVCVVDGRGKIVKEAKVASEPERGRIPVLPQQGNSAPFGARGFVPERKAPPKRDSRRRVISKICDWFRRWNWATVATGADGESPAAVAAKLCRRGPGRYSGPTVRGPPTS